MIISVSAKTTSTSGSSVSSSARSRTAGRGAPVGTRRDQVLSGEIKREKWLSIRLRTRSHRPSSRPMRPRSRTAARFRSAFREKGQLTQGTISRPACSDVKVYLRSSAASNPATRWPDAMEQGVVSTIVPVEDMPFMCRRDPDRPRLEPLGVPSRLNVGPVLEAHLVGSAKGIGTRSAGWSRPSPR